MLDNDILRNVGGMHRNSLTHVLHFDDDTIDNDIGEFNIITHSPYYNDEKIINLFKDDTHNFIVLSLNIQSLRAKFDQLSVLLSHFENFFKISAICLQETWLSEDSDLSCLSLPNYNFIHKAKRVSEHGGLGIFLHNDYTFKELKSTKMSELFEAQFIAVNNDMYANNIIIGNFYRPPRDLVINYQNFTSDLEQIMQNFRLFKEEILICGDFNIDILKANEKEHVNNYLNKIFSSGFLPYITLPTRISNNSATLIDNFFCRFTKNVSKISSGILISGLSDHFPYFISAKHQLKKENKEKFIEIKRNTPKDINNFRIDVAKAKLNDLLDSSEEGNPNSNYNIIHDILVDCVKKNLSSKKLKFNKHKHKKSAWITKGIIKSISFRDKLYQTLKKTPFLSAEYERLKINLNTYNKLLKSNIRLAKKNYYFSLFKV